VTAGTPSQTAGPFVSIGTTWNTGSGSGSVLLTGCVRDGAGSLVTDALLEFWSPGVFARAFTGDDGCYQVTVDDVPHIEVSIFARGLMQRLVTRIYFSDEDDDLGPEVRQQLLAQVDSPSRFMFDIYLQGAKETVFFSPWTS
jgi:protocatechuate 3,4-dioxygenase alpha subunit